MNLPGLLQSVAAAHVAVLAPPADPARPALAMPRIVAEEKCERGSPEAEIVVCGRSNRDKSYRIPEELREQPALDRRDASWATRARDERSLQRYSDQMVGSGGYLQHSRQIDCEWRMERQAIEGKPLDCTAKGIALGK